MSATDLLAHVVRVGPFPRERQVEAQLAALERERQGAQNAVHLAAIAEQEALFKAELARMDREGDYVDPEGPKSLGTVACVGTAGRERIII